MSEDFLLCKTNTGYEYGNSKALINRKFNLYNDISTPKKILSLGDIAFQKVQITVLTKNCNPCHRKNVTKQNMQYSSYTSEKHI